MKPSKAEFVRQLKTWLWRTDTNCVRFIGLSLHAAGYEREAGILRPFYHFAAPPPGALVRGLQSHLTASLAVAAGDVLHLGETHIGVAIAPDELIHRGKYAVTHRHITKHWGCYRL